MSLLERDSPVPLYYQLMQLLRRQIASGAWQPGDKLPPEEQLTEQYGLSRTTVRQALKELELAGLISRERGRGTFVSRPKLAHSPQPRYSLTDFLRRQGLRPGWRLLSAGWAVAPVDVAQSLGLEPGERAHYLRRLRLADEEPIGYHQAFCGPAWATLIDRHALTEGGSLAYLGGTGRLADSYAHRTIEAIPARAPATDLLAIEPGSPLLLIRRQLFSAQHRPIEAMQAMYRGDRFQYEIRHMPGDLGHAGRPG